MVNQNMYKTPRTKQTLAGFVMTSVNAQDYIPVSQLLGHGFDSQEMHERSHFG